MANEPTRGKAVDLWEQYGHDAAWAEGWDLFVRGGDVDGELEIEYNQNPEDWPEGETEARFNGDDEVIALCISRHERHHLLALYLEGRPANQDTWMPPDLMPRTQAEVERDNYYVKAAQDKHNDEGTLEVDDNATVSRGDDPGVYVQAWVWVYDDATPHTSETDPAGMYTPNDTHICALAREFVESITDEDMRDSIETLPDVDVMSSRLVHEDDVRPYRSTAEDIIRHLGPFQVKDAGQIDGKGFDVISDLAYKNFKTLAEADRCLQFCEALAKLGRPNPITQALEEEKRNEAEG
jgi:hypothetical protein